MDEKRKIFKLNTEYWYTERIVYLVGGAFVFVSVLLGMTLDSRWLYFSLFVGFMFMNFAVTGYCPMAILANKLGARRKQ